jgi:hypothetical protein
VDARNPGPTSAHKLCLYLATEALARSLPGHAQGCGYPIPAAPVCAGTCDTLGKHCLMLPRPIGCLSDRPQISEILDSCRVWVAFFSECLEPVRSFLDLSVRVLHTITSSSEEPVELSLER